MGAHLAWSTCYPSQRDCLSTIVIKEHALLCAPTLRGGPVSCIVSVTRRAAVGAHLLIECRPGDVRRSVEFKAHWRHRVGLAKASLFQPPFHRQPVGAGPRDYTQGIPHSRVITPVRNGAITVVVEFVRCIGRRQQSTWQNNLPIEARRLMFAVLKAGRD